MSCAICSGSTICYSSGAGRWLADREHVADDEAGHDADDASPGDGRPAWNNMIGTRATLQGDADGSAGGQGDKPGDIQRAAAAESARSDVVSNGIASPCVEHDGGGSVAI